MIAYLAPDHDVPSGGVKTLYRHVEILEASGREACILHHRPGFRCTWFDSKATVRAIPETPLGPDDLLVIPEDQGPNLAQIGSGVVPVVVFAQNVHYMWRGYSVPPIPQAPTPYRDPVVLGTMMLTAYEREHVRWAFPEHRVWVVPHGIDPAVFYPGEKRNRIAWMPRKHPDEAQAVFGWLWAKGVLQDWEVVAIDGLSESATADVLRTCRLFFAFGYPEGGTLPPFEAAACGALPIGYGGFASDGDLRNIGGWVAPSGDSCAFAQLAARALTTPIDQLNRWGAEAGHRAWQRFSLAGEVTDLLRVMADVGR